MQHSVSAHLPYALDTFTINQMVKRNQNNSVSSINRFRLSNQSVEWFNYVCLIFAFKIQIALSNGTIAYAIRSGWSHVIRNTNHVVVLHTLHLSTKNIRISSGTNTVRSTNQLKWIEFETFVCGIIYCEYSLLFAKHVKCSVRCDVNIDSN